MNQQIQVKELLDHLTHNFVMKIIDMKINQNLKPLLKDLLYKNNYFLYKYLFSEFLLNVGLFIMEITVNLYLDSIIIKKDK